MPRLPWLRSKRGSLANSSRSLSPAVPSKSSLANHDEDALGNLPEAEQPKIEPCRSLWDRAYDDLSIKNKDLVEAFENILISDHETNASWNLEDGDPLKREKQMSALVNEKLATMNEKGWLFKTCGLSVELREQVDRIVKVIFVAKDFITPLANLDPIHAGLPWAGVCILLQLMVKDTAQRAAAIEGLEYISQLVRRYTQIEHVYLQNKEFELRKDLEDIIEKLYTQILEYEARASCQFNRRNSHQTIRNIVGADSWDSILNSIKSMDGECAKFTAIIDASDQQTCMKQLEIMLSQQDAKVSELLKASRAQDEALLAELKAMRNDQKALSKTQGDTECLQCFRVVDYENTMEKNPDRVSGTCEWFLRHSRYTDWLNGQASNLLWVTADPGCGKSVLSRFLVHHYRSWMWKNVSICYFFFKDDSEGNRSDTHALCSILHQLFLQNPVLLKHAMPEFRSNGNKLSDLFHSLWSILLRAAADPNNGVIVCILDALDECSAVSCKRIVEHLADFQSTGDEKIKIKFLVTSRPNDVIWRTFSHKVSSLASIQLMGENEEEMKEICAEINLLVDDRVEKFKELRSKYGIEDNADVVVKAKLGEIENRTYLWTALIFPELDKVARNAEDDLLDAIKRLPSTVDEAYEKILSNSSDVHRARRLLHIVCAAFRPLTLAEMNLALSIKDKDHMNAPMPLQAFGTYIRDLCGLFIRIQNSSIYLIHQTAKEFLTCGSNPEEPFSSAVPHERPWKNSLKPTESHHVLAQICMSYFFSTKFEGGPSNIEQRRIVRNQLLGKYAQENNFLHYAAVEWATHFRGAGYDQTSLCKLAAEICDPHSRPFKTWWPRRLGGGEAYPPKLTSLHVASYLGLEDVVRLLLARDDVKADCEVEHVGTPLSFAALRGHHEVMKLLLARDDVDPNSRGYMGWTPLQSAIEQGHTQAVELLLAHGNIDPDRKDRHGRTPLSWAARYGNCDMMKLLLARHDVDPDSTDVDNRTPLSYPAAGRDLLLTRVLFTDDFDPDFKNDNNPTLGLHDAKYDGYDKIKLLLARGVDPDSKDVNNRTPLSYAAEHGKHDGMELLFAQGVDPDSKDIDHRTPLSHASGWGSSDAMKLLLAHGADPNSKDINSRTPLSYAACNPTNHDGIKSLLAQDVDPDSKDNHNRTPLSWAAERGTYRAIKLLLDRGVDPDSKDTEGRTPLAYAVTSSFGCLDKVNILLARDDVDPDAADIKSRTPTSLARARKWDEVEELIRARKAAIASRVDRQAGSGDTEIPPKGVEGLQTSKSQPLDDDDDIGAE